MLPTAEEVKRKEDTCDFFKIRELEEKLFDSTEMIKTLEEQLNGIKKNQEEAKAAEKIMKAETEVEMKIMREVSDILLGFTRLGFLVRKIRECHGFEKDINPPAPLPPLFLSKLI